MEAEAMSKSQNAVPEDRRIETKAATRNVRMEESRGRMFSCSRELGVCRLLR
jgi:hypothetical protein